MKNILVILCLLVFTSMVSFAQTTVNDPNAEKRNVQPFQSISVSNAFDVFLSQSNEAAVAVSSSDSAFLKIIVTEVKNGTLYVAVDKKSGYRGNKKLRAYISFKELKVLDINGACDVYINNSITATDLKVVLSGASNLKGKILVENLLLNISGASDAFLEGSVQNVKVKISGASKFTSSNLVLISSLFKLTSASEISLTGTGQSTKIDASGASKFSGISFSVKDCVVEASGASKVSITAHSELAINANGASKVSYKGEAKITKMSKQPGSKISKE